MKHEILMAFRADEPLRDDIHAHVERLRSRSPGRRVSVAQALRDLVLRGLATVQSPNEPLPSAAVDADSADPPASGVDAPGCVSE